MQVKYCKNSIYFTGKVRDLKDMLVYYARYHATVRDLINTKLN